MFSCEVDISSELEVKDCALSRPCPTGNGCRQVNAGSDLNLFNRSDDSLPGLSVSCNPLDRNK